MYNLNEVWVSGSISMVTVQEFLCSTNHNKVRERLKKPEGNQRKTEMVWPVLTSGAGLKQALRFVKEYKKHNKTKQLNIWICQHFDGNTL